MSLFDHPRFHLLRHGQTAHNAADLIAGATDAPLDTTGLAQARAMARALAADRPGLAIIPAPDLAERHWGIGEGAPRAVLDREATPLGGESPAAFHTRILRGCAAIPAPDGPENPPLIVAHSGTVRVLCAALGVDFRRPTNCALITFYRDRRGCWQADPPRIAADFPTQPMRFP